MLGAHIIGPQASILIQPLVQAMQFGQTADAVAHGQYWIHPAMAEVVENALIDALARIDPPAPPRWAPGRSRRSFRSRRAEIAVDSMVG